MRHRARWLADPTGDHAYRLWDGRAWTSRVVDRGEEARDPLAGRELAAPALWRPLLPSLAGVLVAAVVVGVVALVAALTRTTPRETGTFSLRFGERGAYQVHRVHLQAGDTLHARVLVTDGSVRLGLGLPKKVLDDEPGFPLTVFSSLRHNGASALLAATGNPDLEDAVVAAGGGATVSFPGFDGWVAPDLSVVRPLPLAALRPGALTPFTAQVSGTYDVIVIGERPGAQALLNVHITHGGPSVDLGRWGNVVLPDQPPTAAQVLKDLLADTTPPTTAPAPGAGALRKEMAGSTGEQHR